MNRQWRILHTEAAMGWGGQQMRVLSEARGMIDRGHTVTLACQPNAKIAERAPEWDVPTFTTGMTGAFDIAGIAALKAFIQEFRPHIVNAHSSRDAWTGLIAARLAGSNVTVRTRHGHGNIKRSFESRLLYCRLSDAISATGEATREYVIERIGLPPERVVSIPTGIDLRRFDPKTADKSAFRRDIGVEENAPLVGMAAVFIACKGVSYFVEATARIAAQRPDVRFVIVGDKPIPDGDPPKFVEQIEKLGMKDKIILAGFRKDMPNVLAAMTVFVCPSLSEGMPQVVTQALAMKCPVVATRVGGIPEQIIDGVTGYLVERANAEQIADRALRMLTAPDEAARMGEEGRVHAERNFSIEEMLDRTEALYERLIESGQSV